MIYPFRSLDFRLTLRQLFRLLACLAAVGYFAGAVFAQTTPDQEQGLKPYGAYSGGDIDTVSLTNGTLDVHIPFLSYPQRGGKLKFSYTLRYGYGSLGINAVCPPSFPCHYYVSGGPGSPGMLQDQLISAFPVLTTTGTVHYWNVADPDGAVHNFGNTTGSIWRSLDATGMQYNATSGVITDAAGTTYDLQYNSSTGVGTDLIEDSNGNEISMTQGTWTDSLGRVVPNLIGVVTTDYSGCVGPLPVSSAVTWTVPGFNGGTETYKFCNANTPFDFTLTETSQQASRSGSLPQLQSVLLPNGTSWIFTYESTYGALASITEPTGGSISYTWTPVYQATCTKTGTYPQPFLLEVTSRTVNANDGAGGHTWTYTQGSPVTVTDPLGNAVVHTITGLAGSCSMYETQTQYYQGSSSSGTLLKTVVTDYNYTTNPDGSTFPLEMNVVPIHVTTTWAANKKVSRIEKDYDSGFGFDGNNFTGIYGDVIAEREYDYGTGTWGALLRQTLTSYYAFSNSSYLTYNLLKTPASVKVQDGGGTQRAYTTYAYDGSALSSSGITTQHDASPANGSVRGNQTSVSRWLNTTGGNLTSSAVYFDTGTANTMTDPKGNTTTYAFSSTYAGAYPTTVTNALHQATTNVYDFNSALLTSTTDPNSQTTSYTYDPETLRKTGATYPDGGQANFCYSDTASEGCSSGPPYLVNISRKITASLTYAATGIVDGLGRETETEVTSDPSGTDIAAVTYDPLGRKATVTNPYRASGSVVTATEGTTSYQYDALNRPTLVTKPDGSTVQTAYCGGSSTLVTDEAGHWRRSTTDGIGRLIEVDEPNSTTAAVSACPSGGDPIWVTAYTYDALNDLTGATQGGTHPRSFIFDSLKRLTSSTNPEAGTVTYTYDADNNVQTKLDARGITITYGWDALNRMLSRTYSNSDPTVTYTYDQATCVVVSSCYNIGRRTGTTDAGGSEAWAYDKMGREIGEQRTTNAIVKNTSYTYNLDGSLATLTYPSGRTISYSYNGAAQPTQALDNANETSYASNGFYAPSGALMTLSYSTTSNTTILYNSRLQPCWIYTNIVPSNLPYSTACTGTASVGSILDMKYNFNLGADNGNVVGITNNRDTTRSQAFTYDQVNRLVTAETTSTFATSPAHCWGEAYVYDNATSGEFGNLTNINVASTGYNGCTQESLGVTALASNQLSATGFSYDASGNNLADSHNTYGWNAESEIKSAAGVNYTYDSDGDRVQKSNGKIYWYGAGSQVLDESDASGNITDEYIYFGGRRIAHRAVSSNTFYFYVEDMLGSSRALATSAGALCYDADFYPFGGERAYSNTCAQNYKFTGKERDAETNNDDFEARYYSSAFGRFLSADWSSTPSPVPYANLTNPQTLNLYAMVSDNPESFVDLDGHYACGPSCHGKSGDELVGSQGGGGWAGGFSTENYDDDSATISAHNWTPIANALQPQNQSATQTQQTSQTTSSSSTSPDRIATALSNVPGVASVTPAPDPTRDKAIGGHQNETDALTFKTPEDQAKFLAESSRQRTIPGDVSENGFGPGVRLPGGLHVEQGRVDPVTGQFLVTSHIDRFNPNNGLGPLVGHAVVDVFIGTVFFHHTAGLDQ